MKVAPILRSKTSHIFRPKILTQGFDEYNKVISMKN